MFEKLGWMAMAKEHKNNLKIEAYKEGIKHLLECLDKKEQDTVDVDRKNDLKILQDNVECLADCTRKLLSGEMHTNCDKNEDTKNAHPATNCGLAHWMKYMFEKLGWMCLSKKHGHHAKIQSYLDSIQRLKASLITKIDSVQEKDRKDDLEIIYHNICVLEAAAHKLLGHEHQSTHLSRRSSSNRHSSKRSRRHSSRYSAQFGGNRKLTKKITH
jgi:hypothetical protein